MAIDLTPPVAKQIPTTIATIHGDEIVNDYEWLRDLADPDVLAYLNAENRYTEHVMASTEALRARLISEFAARSAPAGSLLGAGVDRGAYTFESRTVGEKPYPIVQRRRRRPSGTSDVVVLDFNELAADHPFLRLNVLEPSDDGELLAYGVDRRGNERYALSVKDLRDGSMLVRDLPNADTMAWSSDGRTLFYVEVEDFRWWAFRLWRLDVRSGDRDVIYEEADRLLSLQVRRSNSGAMIYLDVDQTFSKASLGAVEVRAIDADRPSASWRLIYGRDAGFEARVEDIGDRLYLRVNDHGPYCRVVSAPLSSPSPDQWTELVPHRPSVALDELRAFANHVVVMARSNPDRFAYVIPLAGGAPAEIRPPEVCYTLDVVSAGCRYDDDVLRLRYSSFVTPSTELDCDLREGTQTAVWREDAANIDPSRYTVERLWAPADDGESIPISFVRRQDRDTVGLELYGYGSYGSTYAAASFDASRFSLLDRGVAYAVAHIRGGGDGGRPWHDAARRLTKKRTHTDFIAACEFLVATGRAPADRVVIQGASAGGLLVLVCADLRPELFRAVVARVPLADPLHVEVDGSGPFATAEVEEYGDPRASREEYDYLRSYCPYTNIGRKAYPPMYVTTSLDDGQAPYWEAAKYVAGRRHLGAEGELVFRVFRGAHGGPSLPAEANAERAHQNAFILKQLGLADASPAGASRARHA